MSQVVTECQTVKMSDCQNVKGLLKILPVIKLSDIEVSIYDYKSGTLFEIFQGKLISVPAFR